MTVSSVDQTFPKWPQFSEDEIAAVASVLHSGQVNYWTGQEGRSFEREYAEALGRDRAIALMNGTVALELSLRMLGIGPGDEVVVTPRSFIASASCVALLGARPVFADIDPVSGNLTAQTIERALTPRTRAVVLVHLAGWPCEMDDILALAEERRLMVIEDCAQAHGATYKGKEIGSFGYAAAFSFCQDKIITTGGEGGLLATDDEEMWSRAWAFKDHGKSFDAVYKPNHPPGFRWLHESIGTNWRMTEAQAAIGRLQLRKLPEWSAKRRANAALLAQSLSDAPALRIPQPPEHVRHAYYRFYAHLELDRLKSGWDRDRIVAEVNELGVPCFSGSCCEIYREKAFERNDLVPEQPLPVAGQFALNSIALLVHPTLEAHHIERMSAALRTVLRQAVR
jgi:dTDP-4-amino-4,6-dideoxygalactose transaminase